MKKYLLISIGLFCFCSARVLAQSPNLPTKATLSQTLLSSRTFSNATQVDTAMKFMPTLTNYTLEVVGQVNSATGRGLDIDLRNSNGKGARLSLDASSLKTSTPLANSTGISTATAGVSQTIRIAVRNDSAHIYQNGAYLQSQPLTTINDIIGGVESSTIQGTAPGPNVMPGWAAITGNFAGKPSDYGWAYNSTTSTTLFNTANSNSGSRYLDVSATATPHTYNGTTYNGRLLFLRWDANELATATYTYAVTLEAGTAYNFSMLNAYVSNATGSKNFTVGIGKTTAVVDRFASHTFVTSGTADLKRDNFYFVSQEAGTYYLTFTGPWGVFSAAELSLSKYIASSLIPNWAGIAPNNSGTPGAYSWGYTGTTSTLFNKANSGSGVRYLDINASSGANIHTDNGAAYTGRIMYIRWDGSAISSMVYNYPVMLEANTTYNFSMLCAYVSNATGGKTVTVGIGTTNTVAGRTASQSYSIAGTRALANEAFTFTSGAAGLYYLTFTGDWALFSIAELSLTKTDIKPRFIFGKNYPAGAVNMNISSVTYDDGAYAPATITQGPKQDVIVTGTTASFVPTSNTNFIVPGKTDMHLTGAGSPLINSTVQLNSNDSWLFFDNIKPSLVIANWLQYVNINGTPAAGNPNVRISIYQNGTVIIPNGNITSTQALQVYTGQNLTGATTSYEISTYHDSLGTFNNAIRSFKLKRGYMATFANNSDGSGFSRVFIANDADLVVNTMPQGLDATASFIRVFKWDWVSKKGKAGWSPEQVGATWYYDWNIGGAGNSDYNYAIIRQNGGWPAWTDIHNKQEVNHLLGFNEPDQTNQSNLIVDQAVQQYPEMMKSGLRVGSPAPANPESSWITKFLAKTDSLNLRVDFVAIHCYWGGQTPSQWYTRLKAIYDRVKRPLWITEWNNGANWTGESWPADTTLALQKQLNDLKGILNVLDTASFVERYAEYDWVEYKRALVLADTLTPAGKYYYANKSALAYNANIAPAHNWQLAAPIIYSTINNDNFTKVTLNWLDMNGELGSKYVLERKIDGVDTVFRPVKEFAGYVYGGTMTFVDTVYSRASYRIGAFELSGTHSVYSAILIISQDKAPVAPTALTGTAVSSTITNLTWNAGANARGYNLKRSRDPAGPFTTILSQSTAVSYRDTSLSPGINYYYVVSSLNSAGESENSTILQLTTKPLVAPTAVINPYIASGDTRIAVTWDFQYDAKYEVSRAASPNGSFAVIATNLATTRFEDTSRGNGATYYYKVVAFNAAGRSPETAVLSGTPILGQYLHIGFNENTGTFTRDDWGGYNGTVVNGATWVAGKDGPTGALGLVKANSSYVQLPNGVVSKLSDFTIATWVKLPSTLATNTRIFDFGNNSSNFMTLIPKSGSNVRYKITSASGTDDRSMPYVLPTNQWVHITISQQGSVFKFYVNGTLQYTDANATVKPSALGVTTRNYLGKSQYSTDPYSDHIYDDFKIFDRALSDAEVVNLTKTQQTITFNALPAQKFGNPDLSPGATASSGLPVSYTSSDSTVATIVAGKIHITGIGTALITANQEGNDSIGYASGVSQSLTVTDQTPPVITLVPGPVVLAPDASGSRTVKLSDVASVTDDVTKKPTVTLSPSVLNCQSLGNQTIVITAVDSSGNSSNATATVMVKDTIAPTAIAQNITVQLDTSGTATINAAQINNGSTDNCSATSFSLDKTNFDCSDVGQNNVTLKVTDASGNVATAIAVVTVEDHTPPTVFTKNIMVSLRGGKAIIVPSQIDNGSYDACGIQSMSLSKATFDCSSQGKNTVTLTVTDIHNNTATGTAVVTIIGQTPSPTIEVSRNDNTYTGLDAKTIALGYGAQSLILTATETNSGSEDTFAWSPAGGLSGTTTSNAVFTPTQPGTYTFTVTATSQYGCQAVASVTINVIDVRCGTNKVSVCHATGSKSNPYTQICISRNAVPAQLTNGSSLGICSAAVNTTASLTSASTGTQDSVASAVPQIALKAYPNPFAKRTTITYSVPSFDQNVTVEVYNSIGHKVSTVYSGSAQPNVINEYPFDGSNLAPGIYFIRLTTAKGVQTFRMIMAR